MTPNKFLISDASFDMRTDSAGIGVIDLHTKRKYMQKLENCPDSQYAEYRALILSAQIALQNKYDNVVFVYDNMTLNVKMLDKHLIDRIKHYQFLWLKREYLHEADKLARKAHELQQTIYVEQIYDLVQAYKSYGDNSKLKTMMLIATSEQRKVLKAFIDKERHAGFQLDEKNIHFFRTAYGLIQNNKLKKKFLNFLNRHFYINIFDREIFKKQSKKHYAAFIQSIFDTYKQKTLKTTS